MKKIFEIETSPKIMQRIERFFALLHYNSSFGHSAIFAMPLDGDGADKVSISPIQRKLAKEVELIGSVGGDIEQATDVGYTCYNKKELGSYWVVKPTVSLFKNDELRKTKVPR